MILHKIVRKLVIAYEKSESKDYARRLKSVGENTLIGYPALLAYPQNITVGSNTEIKSYSRLQTFLEEGEQSYIKIGNDSFFGFRLSIQATAPVEIGNNNVFGSDVSIVSHNHGMEIVDGKPFMDQPLTSAPIKIGNNVWAGDKVTILPGVTIGNNVILAAGSIVNKSVPDNAMVAGIPAKIIKMYNKEKKEWEKVK